MGLDSPLQRAIAQCIKTSYRDDVDGHLEYSFPESFLGFKGHFPGYPVLPAVIQCRLGIEAANFYSGKDLKLVSVLKAKFKQQVKPNMDIKVTVSPAKASLLEDYLFSVKINNSEGLVASFSLQLAL